MGMQPDMFDMVAQIREAEARAAVGEALKALRTAPHGHRSARRRDLEAARTAQLKTEMARIGRPTSPPGPKGPGGTT